MPKPRRQSHPTPFYSRLHETANWVVEGGQLELHRIVVSKIPHMSPGTSALITVTPVVEPGTPLGIKANQKSSGSYSRPNPRKTKWTKERNYIIIRQHGGIPDYGKPRGTSQPDILRHCLPATIPSNLEYGIYEHCLLWTGNLDGGGYARANGERIHRLTYEYANFMSIGKQQSIFHLCQRPYCIQPGHLYAGTPKQNAMDRDVRSGNFIPTSPRFPKSLQASSSKKCLQSHNKTADHTWNT